MIQRKLYYFFSPVARRKIRELFYLPADILDKLKGRHQKLVPPRGKIFTGSGDFVKQGDHIFENISTLCEITPSVHVLDIGSGIGRVARPFAEFLSEEGKYTGFDVVEEGIKWCKQNYTSYPNFTFTYIPLLNDLYNLSLLYILLNPFAYLILVR